MRGADILNHAFNPCNLRSIRYQAQLKHGVKQRLGMPFRHQRRIALIAQRFPGDFRIGFRLCSDDELKRIVLIEIQSISGTPPQNRFVFTQKLLVVSQPA